MKKILILLLVSFVTPVYAQEFTEGQAWAYKTREHETDSFIQITRIDDGPEDDRVISIAIFNLKMEIINYPQPYMEMLPHLPVSENMLKENVTHQVDSITPPQISTDGYNTWKSEFDKGNAGWWTINVSEIVGATEKMVNDKIKEMGDDFPM